MLKCARPFAIRFCLASLLIQTIFCCKSSKAVNRLCAVPSPPSPPPSIVSSLCRLQSASLFIPPFCLPYPRDRRHSPLLSTLSGRLIRSKGKGQLGAIDQSCFLSLSLHKKGQCMSMVFSRIIAKVIIKHKPTREYWPHRRDDNDTVM